jgi:hypothetical protein
MYGKHRIPCRIENEQLSITVEKRGGGISYERALSDTRERKLIFGAIKNIRIAPVEPLNTPKEIARHLLIHCDIPIMVEPKGQVDVYLTFPVEVGVFVDSKGSGPIDVFSMPAPRFALYGDPNSGLICRYWKSPVLKEIGEHRPFHEGVMRLRIVNSAGDWSQMKRVILDAVSMKIYYSKDLVGLKGQVNLMTPTTAETWCKDAPLVEGMQKSDELFTGKKLALGEHKFVMREGL